MYFHYFTYLQDRMWFVWYFINSVGIWNVGNVDQRKNLRSKWLSRNLEGINLIESDSIPIFVVWKTIV